MPHLTHIPDVCRLAAAFAQALPQYGWTLPFASWWHGRVLQCAHSLATGGAIEPLSQQHAQRDMMGLTSEAAPSCVGCCPSPASQRVLRRECVALAAGGLPRSAASCASRDAGRRALAVLGARIIYDARG